MNLADGFSRMPFTIDEEIDVDRLCIIIPAYNEAENIKFVIDAWYQIIEKYPGRGRIVVIDDGSTDNTYNILKDYATGKPLLKVLTKSNSGHGATVLYGYKYALEHGADYIFQTDSDGQTNPEEFKKFWSLRNEYPAIIGKRINREDGRLRKIVEKVLCILLKYYFHVSIPDANAPFRLMSRQFLDKYIGKIPNGYNLPNAALVAIGLYYKENIEFIEISFKARQGGTNSVNLKKIFKIGFYSLSNFSKISKSLQEGNK